MLWPDYMDIQRIPIFLAVTLQVWIDIRVTLGNCSPNWFGDLQEQGEETVSLMRSGLKHATSQMRKETENNTMPDVYATLGAIAKRVRNDNFTKNLLALRQPWLHMEGPPPFTFLKHQPFLCGMQSWWLEQQYRKFVAWAVKIHESIAPAALLYLAIRDMGWCGPWPDMDFVLQTRGREIVHLKKHTYQLGKYPHLYEIPSFFQSQFNRRRAHKAEAPSESLLLTRFMSGVFKYFYNPDTLEMQ
ncbi:hypothetical protein F4777DRAFT_110018 [Nemania sp. FL0916]|nr:hypothetical protein F4777DRAFT_110018 [Nemania sp. FL0916]